MVWREEAVWQVEGVEKFGPNVVSFLLALGARMWYVIRSYVPPKKLTTVYQVEQVFAAKPKGVDISFLEGPNARLGERYNKRKEDLATALADHIFEYVT